LDSPAPEFGFVVDPTPNVILLAHPLVDAAWRWDEDGRIVATTLAHRPSGAAWIDPAFPSQLYRPPDDASGHGSLNDPRRPVDANGMVRGSEVIFIEPAND